MITLTYIEDKEERHLFCKTESVAVLAALILQARYAQDPFTYAVCVPQMTIKGPKGPITVPLFEDIQEIKLSCAFFGRDYSISLTSVFGEYLSGILLSDIMAAIPRSMHSPLYQIVVISSGTHTVPYALRKGDF